MPTPLPERPKLRAVEAFPVEIRKGERAIALRDPFGFARNIVALPRAVFALVALFNGKRTVADVQAEWARMTGELVFAEQIEGFLRTLDENLFMEGERFERARAEEIDGFRRAPVRAAAHAGAAYPGEAKELGAFIDELFLREGGPGRVPGAGGGEGTGTSKGTGKGTEGAGGKAERDGEGRLVGVVAPHIDPRRGNTVYAHAFDAVARAGGADLYVILGTAHQGGDDLYMFTRKPFETPFGTVATDTAFIDRLEARIGGGRRLDRAEFPHRTEHSVEFEVVFLKYVEDRIRRRAAPKIVPLICNSLHPWVETRSSPAGECEEVARLVAALRAEIAEEEAQGRRVVCIAGADLAHIGLKFGHERAVDESFARECEEKDRASLERAAATDGEGFFSYVAAERDARNICGLSCTYTLLKLLEGGAARGNLLAYGQAPDPMPGSIVTFASLAYYA